MFSSIRKCGEETQCSTQMFPLQCFLYHAYFATKPTAQAARLINTACLSEKQPNHPHNTHANISATINTK